MKRYMYIFAKILGETIKLAAFTLRLCQRLECERNRQIVEEYHRDFFEEHGCTSAEYTDQHNIQHFMRRDLDTEKIAAEETL